MATDDNEHGLIDCAPMPRAHDAMAAALAAWADEMDRAPFCTGSHPRVEMIAGANPNGTPRRFKLTFEMLPDGDTHG